MDGMLAMPTKTNKNARFPDGRVLILLWTGLIVSVVAMLVWLLVNP